MKILFTTLMLAGLSLPALAQPMTFGGSVSIDLPAQSGDGIGRRSGRCPHRPDVPMLPGAEIGRERSTNTCGGV